MKQSRRKFLRNSLLSIMGLLFLDTFWLEKFFIKTLNFHLNDQSFNPIKLLQVSDLHLKSIRWRHRRLIKKINDLQPDLIAFTGDAIEDQKYIDLLDQFLQQIDPTIQKVAIMGNWEYWGHVDVSQLRKLYKRHNCDLLINENRQYRFNEQTINITGIDDWVGSHADYKAATADLKDADYHVVLTHCPAHKDQIDRERGAEKIDLILSGHTHGGQIKFFGFAPYTPPGSGHYVRGWYNDEATNFYVSSGVGTSVFPFRLGSRAEITLFHI
ncbi:MAG: metallophosphoesterase [Bacteroidota bacterium]